VVGDAIGDVMFGLDGFVVRSVCRYGNELEVTVRTTATRVACRECGIIAAAHDRRDHVLRDVAIAGSPVAVVWQKAVWRCPDQLCGTKTWSERSPQILARASLTERARADICRQAGLGVAVSTLARAYGVGWDTAMRAVRDHGKPLVDDPARTAGVAKLGVDETSFLLANRDHHTMYMSGFVDLERGVLIDIVAGRAGDDIAYWLYWQPDAWLAAVREVALDPHRGYANGLARLLDHATFVLDHFHAIKLANAMVDDVRRRAQNETLGHRGHKNDPLYGIRRLLQRASETLTHRQSAKLVAALDAGDNDRREVTSAWFAREALRRVYDTTNHADAIERLGEFYAEVAAWDVPEAKRLARTIRAWEPELLNWHTTGGTSNGPTEAINLVIEKVRRVGHGYRNPDNYRLRLLLIAGGINWHTQPTARLRTRQPRLAA
jgi:transposase